MFINSLYPDTPSMVQAIFSRLVREYRIISPEMAAHGSWDGVYQARKQPYFRLKSADSNLLKTARIYHELRLRCYCDFDGNTVGVSWILFNRHVVFTTGSVIADCDGQQCVGRAISLLKFSTREIESKQSRNLHHVQRRHFLQGRGQDIRQNEGLPTLARKGKTETNSEIL